ncbi:hypothetical protein ABT297_00245 [Dactylosporangium sp. NPDC000555]|uniref:hypothetical protein n=1 Tax=Dactylosporangium sp. NPDC000555 TaxID=3154260 RepID=UPI0033304BAA
MTMTQPANPRKPPDDLRQCTRHRYGGAQPANPDRGLDILRHFGFSAREAGGVRAHRATVFFTTTVAVVAAFVPIVGAVTLRTQ